MEATDDVCHSAYISSKNVTGVHISGFRLVRRRLLKTRCQRDGIFSTFMLVTFLPKNFSLETVDSFAFHMLLVLFN